MLDKSLKSKLATAIADEVYHSACQDEFWNGMADQILDVIRGRKVKCGKLDEEHIVRHFETLFKAQAGDEQKFKTMVIDIWEKQRRIIIANLKKIKRAYQRKDIIDSILYPIKDFEKMITDDAKKLYFAMILKYGNREIAEYNLDVSFDIQNPHVQNWVKKYTPKFSKELETVNVEKLRAELQAGLDAGEGIPDLVKRINTTYDNWNKIRSETIARSEVIRASNKGAMESYRQSGVVEQKIWLVAPDERLCELCEEMGNREPIDLDELYTTTDYEKIEAPPLHPRCYDDQTEVYTDKGWQYFKNLEGTELCLSLNPNNYQTEFVSIALQISYSFKGEMVYFDFHNLLVTPNHLMIRINKEGKIELIEAQELKVPSVEYNGIVYCVELEKNHILYVRRGLQETWCGNCRCAIAPWMGE